MSASFLPVVFFVAMVEPQGIDSLGLCLRGFVKSTLIPGCRKDYKYAYM
jgi:hypothetical protein